MEILIVFLIFLLALTSKYVFPKILIIRNYINKYILYVGLPLIVLTSLKSLKNFKFLEYIYISVIILLFIIFIIYLFIKTFKISNKKKASLFLCSSFGNTAYLGIPLCFIFFGSRGSVIASIFSIAALLLHLTLGIFLARSYLFTKKSFKTMLKSPLIILLILVMILNTIEFQIPEFLSSISHLSVYLAIFVVGTTMDFSSFEKKTINYVFIKLLLVPIISLFILWILNSENVYVFLFLSAMPSAFINSPLSLEFEFDTKLSSRLITLSTILSMTLLFVFQIFSGFF